MSSMTVDEKWRCQVSCWEDTVSGKWMFSRLLVKLRTGSMKLNRVGLLE